MLAINANPSIKFDRSNLPGWAGEHVLDEQISDEDECPCCGRLVSYDRDNCDNGYFLGFPNIRIAKKMCDALENHYARAREHAAARRVLGEFDRLFGLLGQSMACVNLGVRIASNLVQGQAYASYYRALEARQRTIAKRGFHADRAKVDAAVHTGYEDRIVNIALSPDGRGLPNYGEVALLLKENSVRDRCSALRENAFQFHKRFGLGEVGVREPAGWRSVWDGRAMLGAAALEPELVPGMDDGELHRLILTPGATRETDRFIELHLCDAVMREYVRAFYLAKKLKDEREETIWHDIREKFAQRDVDLIEYADV